MKSQALKQAWEIWILPLIILQAYVSVIVALFVALNNHIQSNDNAVYIAEKMVTFTTGGPALAVLYFMMNRYEKVKQLKTRKWTKRSVFFLIGVYVVYSIILFSELVIEII